MSASWGLLSIGPGRAELVYRLIPSILGLFYVDLAPSLLILASGFFLAFS